MQYIKLCWSLVEREHGGTQEAYSNHNKYLRNLLESKYSNQFLNYRFYRFGLIGKQATILEGEHPFLDDLISKCEKWELEAQELAAMERKSIQFPENIELRELLDKKLKAVTFKGKMLNS